MAFKSPDVERRVQDDSPLAEINIIPLVDVVLVLLIIFMVTVPMMKAGVDVSLPKGKNAAPIQEERLVVYYTQDKKVFAGEDPVHPAVLDERLKAMALLGQAVYLQADSRLSYGEVMAFLDRMKGAGIESVALVIQDEPKTKKTSGEGKNRP
jgi:biopolymer transport protein TolR